jgi:hypothetical protein
MSHDGEMIDAGPYGPFDTVVCVRCRRTIERRKTRDDPHNPGRRRCTGSMATTCARFEENRAERAQFDGKGTP